MLQSSGEVVLCLQALPEVECLYLCSGEALYLRTHLQALADQLCTPVYAKNPGVAYKASS